MSYFITPSSSTTVTLESISSAAFSTSGLNVNWGVNAITPPLGAPDTASNQAAILDIIAVLNTLNITQP
jgi:hypothetical protein